MYTNWTWTDFAFQESVSKTLRILLENHKKKLKKKA